METLEKCKVFTYNLDIIVLCTFICFSVESILNIVYIYIDVYLLMAGKVVVKTSKQGSEREKCNT